MANDTLKGRDYVMEIDTTSSTTGSRGTDDNYKPILCEVSSDFNIETDETTPVSNKCTAQGGWANNDPNLSSWSFSGEWQAIDPGDATPSPKSMDAIADLALSKQKFWARRVLSGETGTVIVREGLVWISSYNDTANTDDPFTFTATFTGVGAPLLAAPVTPPGEQG